MGNPLLKFEGGVLPRTNMEPPESLLGCRGHPFGYPGYGEGWHILANMHLS